MKKRVKHYFYRIWWIKGWWSEIWCPVVSFQTKMIPFWRFRNKLYKLLCFKSDVRGKIYPLKNVHHWLFSSRPTCSYFPCRASSTRVEQRKYHSPPPPRTPTHLIWLQYLHDIIDLILSCPCPPLFKIGGAAPASLSGYRWFPIARFCAGEPSRVQLRTCTMFRHPSPKRFRCVEEARAP